jgi:hypothetical protein
MLRQFPREQLHQVFLEVSHKHFSAFAGEDAFDIRAAVIQMVQDMRDFTHDIFLPRREIVGAFLVQIIGKDMLEDFRTHGAKQFVFRLEMSIKGTAPYVRRIYDFLNRYIGIGLYFEKARECFKHGLPCFFLTSIHHDLPDNSAKKFGNVLLKGFAS